MSNSDLQTPQVILCTVVPEKKSKQEAAAFFFYFLSSSNFCSLKRSENDSNNPDNLRFTNVIRHYFAGEMFFIAFFAFFVPLASGPTVNSEKHSLTYVYTALSKPVNLPGIHEFTAAGLLDGRMIEYYDSDIGAQVPKRRWMKEKLDAEYWKNGTESCLSKQQELNETINYLKTRMNQSSDNLHDLVSMAICEGEKLPDGNIKFLHMEHMCEYDGETIVSMKISSNFWPPFSDEAEQTRRKWDHDSIQNILININLCVDLMRKFISYEQNELNNTQPAVFLLSKQAKVQTNVILTCLATGFYPKNIILEIMRNDRVVQEADGLITSGVRPNHDDTYQRRDSVEVSKTDGSIFKCVFIHKASSVYIEKVWESILPEGNTGVSVEAVGGLIVLVLIVGVVLVVLCKKWIIGNSSSTGSSTGSPTDSERVPLSQPRTSLRGINTVV